MEQYRVVNTPQGPQTYLLVKKRVKNLNLRLDRRGQVLLSVPLGCPEERADALILEKWEWIRRHLACRSEPPPLLPEPDRAACARLLGRRWSGSTLWWPRTACPCLRSSCGR